MKKKPLIALAAALSLAMVLASCGEMSSRSEETGEASAAPVEKRYNVKTVPVIRQELSSYINLSGDVNAAGSVDVYPDVVGKVVSLPVSLGDYVTKGTVLTTVDPSMPGMNYAASPVKAPISGTVTAVNVEMGQTVSQQFPVVTIGDLSQLEIITNIPERFIYQVELGQRGIISSSAAGGNSFDAKVSEIAPVVNQSSRTMETRLIMEGDNQIKAGMFVTIKLITSTSANALTIPEEALIIRNDTQFVYLVAGEAVKKTPVETGKKSNGLVEILSGLDEGDEVVTEGKTLLSDGVKVRIVNNLSFKSILTETEEDNS
ncbi:MAG: efflux RND transporter periplasmic adaptor subunit [Spirochaetales bacterium]|nr:efflux RND transporter periplasmic adaptor subunit [Spirochaetales bacterium]